MVMRQPDQSISVVLSVLTIVYTTWCPTCPTLDAREPHGVSKCVESFSTGSYGPTVQSAGSRYVKDILFPITSTGSCSDSITSDTFIIT